MMMNFAQAASLTQGIQGGLQRRAQLLRIVQPSLACCLEVHLRYKTPSSEFMSDHVSA